MQTANIMASIGEGRSHTVPKYGVTVSEIAVLRAIHGEDAVFDVEPLDAVALGANGRPRTNREELERLAQVYGRAADRENRSIVGQLFPGAAARCFMSLDELDLPPVLFKATTRAEAKPSSKADEPKVLDDLTKAEMLALAKSLEIDVPARATKAEILPLLEAASEAQAASDAKAAATIGGEGGDGIEDINDGGENLFQ